jgi:hypothetical protein
MLFKIIISSRKYSGRQGWRELNTRSLTEQLRKKVQGVLISNIGNILSHSALSSLNFAKLCDFTGIMPSLNSMAKDAKTKNSASTKKLVKEIPPKADLSTEFVQESDTDESVDSDEASSNDDEESLPENSVVAAPKSNDKVTEPGAETSLTSKSRDEGVENKSDDEEEEDEQHGKTVRDVELQPAE